LSDSAAVPLIVLSTSRDAVEAVNALLRRQGVAAHCRWVGSVRELPDAIDEHQPQLLLCVAAEIGVEDVHTAARAVGSKLPLLAIRAGLTEDIMAADLVAGASDTINLAQPERAHRVIARELHTSRLQQAYDEAQRAVQMSREQLDSVMTLTNDAILVVQEGILVEANQAWLELVGTDADAITGQPVMDVFHTDSHVALKGALSACLKGQWKDHVLKANARAGADGQGRVAVELLLTLGEHDEEPCVRIMVPLRKVAEKNEAAAEVPVPTLSPVAPAPAPAPATAPAPSGEMNAPPVPPAAPEAAPATAASPAQPAAATQAPDLDARAREYDSIWVRHIQAALAENRFRLVQQPITNLAGGPPMYDLLIRMLDRGRKEILPGEFLPAAERNNLMGPIDRWVMGAAARFAADAKPGCLFVRLSRQSALDDSMTRWLTAQIQSVKVDPQMLCLTVTEAVAHENVEAVQKQARAIKALGVRFALERFGAGPDPLALLDAVPMDFVKIDGTLTQGVANDSLVQSKIEALVEAARERGIATIAANVEDANTMAVMWQLGVEHLEGFLIQAPEEIVMA
jgi:PAS domain S-box-containing protein